MKIYKYFLTTALCVCALSFPARASIVGTTVTGGFYFNGAPMTPDNNQFDPSNAGSGTVATIGASSPTFSTIVDGEDFNLSADFTSSELNISFAPYRIATTFNGFELTFEDSAFAGLNLSLLSFGGPFTSTSQFSYSISGDTIDFNVISGLPTTGPSSPYTASIGLNAATAAPEPASGALVLASVAGLAALAYRRGRKRIV